MKINIRGNIRLDGNIYKKGKIVFSGEEVCSSCTGKRIAWFLDDPNNCRQVFFIRSCKRCDAICMYKTLLYIGNAFNKWR